MTVKDSTTEQLIKDTAKRIFLTEGSMHATTQDIADAAGINRTLLHYYFRSKEALFNLVFKEAHEQLRDRISFVLVSKAPFKQKIEGLLDVFFDELQQKPYLETFIILQANENPAQYKKLLAIKPERALALKSFLQEIRQEMKKGTLPEMKPAHFFMNIISLITYPFMAKPIFQDLLELDDAGLKKIFSERKKVIMAQLFRG
jgi:AcrR family transcriptional regulator